ncbi:MAG: hypothetical protein ACXV8K_10300 [Ilumatobacteraceae bacterium]
MNTIDDELIRRLCAELDTLTADVPAVPPALSPMVVVGHIVERPGRDRRRVIVLAAAMIALIAAVAGLVAVRRDGGAVGTPASPSSSAPVVTYATSPGVVHPTPPTPDGWDVVEWGNVRLSLPPDLSPFHVGNGCVTTPQGADLDIVCGDQLVRIRPASLHGAAGQTMNGFHVVLRTGECTRCQTLDVYELATTVTVKRAGESPLAIIDTVGPSGSWRYQNELRPTAPADWKTVAYQGVTIRVPASWPTVSSSDASLDPCKIRANTVVVGTETCAQPSLQPPTDGVRLFLADPPITAHDGWPEQQVSAQFDSAPSVVLEVGYGSDQSIGLSILSSFSTESSSGDTLPVPATVALQNVPYVALGESVMLGAKPMLDARGILTFAEVAKGPSWELDQLQLAKAKYHITGGVVIQLGTNGTVTREQYDSLLDELSDVPRVVVMTVRAPKPWIAGNNEIIRSLPATHPNVVVLDWEARSAEVADHLSSSDGGIHLADDTAKAFFRDVILQALGLPT